jgi:glycosyltransferase involved in cell wall biosynthesis
MYISAVIITKDEERNIERCLFSLQGVVDEIIVVDSFSTDKTKNICEQHHVRFVQREWQGYANQKNYANSLARYDYILSIDADEELSDMLIKSILTVKQNPTADAYCMNRRTNYCGKWIRHCGWYPDKKIRLWKKDKASWSPDKIHEKVIVSPDATMLYLKGDLLHYSYYTISEHILQLDKFTEISACEVLKKDKRVTVAKIIFKPACKFIRDYFIKLGFLDGYYGFVICTISSFTIFIKYAKARQLQSKQKLSSYSEQ